MMTGGIRSLLKRLRQHSAALVVLEATGGYEPAVVAALAAARLPVVVANPRQVRDSARATGQLAKTDRIDADTLGLFGERVRPEPRALPDEVATAFDAVLTRRRQILGMIVAERNRLEHARPAVRRGITQHIHWLERQLQDVDRDLDATIKGRPVRCGAPRMTSCASHLAWARSSVARSSASSRNSGRCPATTREMVTRLTSPIACAMLAGDRRGRRNWGTAP